MPKQQRPANKRRERSRNLQQPPSVWWSCFAALLVGGALTYAFWSPLFHGGGIIGGDTYPYYFPQKSYLADSLTSGEIPLWNPLVGFGYPVLGESQTGAIYPPNLVLYSAFSLNTAYNLNQILHYLFAFIATWALARRLGLRSAGALLGATVYTFGWFPPRLCLEWAIIGGAWLSAILWATTAYWQTRSLRYLGLMSLFLGLDLLAGHYNLAFITLLLLLPLPWLVQAPPPDTPDQPQAQRTNHFPALLKLGFAIFLGFGLAATQLLPTWELKQQSQRQEVNERFSPTYGHLPPLAISQLIQPWAWHAAENTADQLLSEATTGAVKDATNKAEAALYCGLLPLLCIVLAVLLRPFREQWQLRGAWGWCAVGLVGLLFATGWPTYYLQEVPGFGFFRGPGRYSIATALAIGILSGAALDAILRWLGNSRSQTALITVAVLGLTAFDLWAFSREYGIGASPFRGRQVFYATLVDSPPVAYREPAKLLSQSNAATNHVRVYAPGANVPTLLGVSALPVYLGIGPEIYETDAVRVDWSLQDPEQINAAMKRMREYGVTLLILEDPLDTQIWPVTFLGQHVEPVLNAALARREPYYLYRINESPGTVYFVDSPNSKVTRVDLTPNRVAIEVDATEPADLVLTQLTYPGWHVSIDDQPAIATTTHDLFRTVQVPQGQHTVIWSYRSTMLRLGFAISLISFGLLAVVMLFGNKLMPRPTG